MLATLLSPHTLLDPRGRCNRRGLLHVAGVLLAAEAALAVWLVQSGAAFDGPIAFAIKLALLWTAIAASCKRLHDCGRSAWWIAIAAGGVMAWCFVLTLVLVVVLGPSALGTQSPWLFAVLVGVLLPIVALALWLHCVPGQDGENAYGPEPDAAGFSMPCMDRRGVGRPLASSTR